VNRNTTSFSLNCASTLVERARLETLSPGSHCSRNLVRKVYGPCITECHQKADSIHQHVASYHSLDGKTNLQHQWQMVGLVSARLAHNCLQKKSVPSFPRNDIFRTGIGSQASPAIERASLSRIDLPFSAKDCYSTSAIEMWGPRRCLTAFNISSFLPSTSTFYSELPEGGYGTSIGNVTTYLWAIVHFHTSLGVPAPQKDLLEFCHVIGSGRSRGLAGLCTVRCSRTNADALSKKEDEEKRKNVMMINQRAIATAT
jgi:hypothetical protein